MQQLFTVVRAYTSLPAASALVLLIHPATLIDVRLVVDAVLALSAIAGSHVAGRHLIVAVSAIAAVAKMPFAVSIFPITAAMAVRRVPPSLAALVCLAVMGCRVLA